MRQRSIVVTASWIVVLGVVILAPVLAAAVQTRFNLRIAASNGKAAGNLQVVLLNPGASDSDLGTTDGEGNLDVALDPAKKGRRYNAYKQSCSRIVFMEAGTPDDTACRDDSKKLENGCRSCEPLGFFIYGETGTVGNFTTSGGFNITAYGTGGGKWTTIANGDEAEGTIDTRFSNTTPPYNQPRQIDIETTGSGAALGGGFNFDWASRVGMRVGVVAELGREVPVQIVEGRRDAGGFIFGQQGSTDLSSVSFTLGPTLQLGSGVVVTGGINVMRWSGEHTHTGSLSVNCPTPCTTVRTDNVITTVTGVDTGFHVGAEYYPGNRWFGFSAMFQRVTLHDVYDPTTALAWPRDWTDNNFFVGVTVRTPGLIR